MQSNGFGRVGGTVLALSAFLPAVSGLAGPQDQAGQFRGRVVLVPVDVRVVDRAGRPVTGLMKEEFVVLQDGEPQDIVVFASETLTARGVSSSGLRAPLEAGARLPSLPGRRTFLIVLGRGRLAEPADGIEALSKWVQTDLLPQDVVGVVAYGRATDLTTDRVAIARLLQAYATHHEEIEARLDSLLDVHLAADASRDVPSLASMREGFDDLGGLYGALEFLRTVDGEKHVIYVTENGLQLAPPSAMGPPGQFGVGLSDSRADPDVAPRYGDFASLAADARVAVSIIQTGGLPLTWSEHGPGRQLYTRTWDELFAVTDTRWVAEATGGIASMTI